VEFQPPEVRQKALALVEASLRSVGFRLVHDMMLINGLLGEVVGLETILNEFSYNFALYGDPDLSAPWAWQLFGHHCAVSCLVTERRMGLSPVCLGAEPNEIDEGPRACTVAFTDRIRLGAELMAELSPDLRAQAAVYRHMIDAEMPPDRIPPETNGISGAFLEIRDHLDQAWLAWIGEHEAGDVFYFRAHPPVLIAELDHHCGIFLDYDTSMPLHVHAVLHTPHGNDYSLAYVRGSHDGPPERPPERAMCGCASARAAQLVVRRSLGRLLGRCRAARWPRSCARAGSPARQPRLRVRSRRRWVRGMSRTSPHRGVRLPRS